MARIYVGNLPFLANEAEFRGLNGQERGGRTLRVNEALDQPRAAGGRQGSGGGYRGGANARW